MKMDWHKAKLRDQINKDLFFIRDRNQRHKAVLAARKLARSKTAKADATKVKERKRHVAEMEAFEARDRFTLIKRSLRHHWPDE